MESHLLSNKEKEKLIEVYVERETAVARKWVEDAETAIKQEQEETRNADNTGLTTREHNKMSEEMMNAIGDSLSDLASSDDEEYGECEDDQDTELGKLSEDDKPGWGVGTISKMVQQRMERFRYSQMKLDESRPGMGGRGRLPPWKR